ncbi:DNA repair protein rhp54 [Hordeum vulgare]|nr:DNA repair protein rhp54 [Hordeum vulgare]
MLAGSEHHDPFHARVGDHQPQHHAGGRWIIVRRYEETPCEMPTDMLTGAHNLSDGMPAAIDDDTTNCVLENMIFECGALVARAYSATAYNPDETQS